MKARAITVEDWELAAFKAGRKTMLHLPVGPAACTVLGNDFPATLWGGLKFKHRQAQKRSESFAGSDAYVGYSAHISVPWVHPKEEAVGATVASDQAFYKVYSRDEVGGRLWVQEPYYLSDDGEHQFPIYASDVATARGHLESLDKLRADFPWAALAELKRLRTAPEMQRWMSRFVLTVTDVRFHPVREITVGQARAAGVVPGDTGDEWHAFLDHWARRFGQEACDRAEPVVAITFTVKTRKVRR